jgi:hypothetical protein
MNATKTEAHAIADATFETAYSAGRYGVTEWRKAAAMLATRGFNAAEIEWVLRSKLTRWAADMGNSPHGHATAQMLRRFMGDARNHATLADVRREVAS